MNDQAIRRAARLLRRGGVVAYPTEAVFGLGCDPRDRKAVRRILRIKRRPWQKGLILIAADFEQLTPYLEPLDPALWDTVLASWPGPVTWLLPARRRVSRWLRGRHRTLAVRVTAHQQAAALCRAFGGAIISTSANRSGRPPVRTTLAVRGRLGRDVDFVLPGAVGGAARPSEIRDPASGRILRAG